MNTRENGLNVQVIEGNWPRNNHAFANANTGRGYANGTGVGDFLRENSDTLLGGGFKLGEAWITANAARDIANAQYGSNNQGNVMPNNMSDASSSYGASTVQYDSPKSNAGTYIVIALAVVGIGVGVYMYKKHKAA